MPAKKKQKRASPKTAEASQLPAHVDTDTKQEYVNNEELLGRLAVELVRSRVRHRALINALREGTFDWSRYTAHIEEVEQSDAQALFDLLILTWDTFRSRYEEWMERDFATYGFRRQGQHAADQGVTIESPSEPTASETQS